MSGRPVILALATLLGALALGGHAAGSAPAPPAAQGTPGAPAWARLGPLGPDPLRAVAVAPNWPSDRLLLAVQGNVLVRSPDGGRLWERLTLPSARVVQLALAPSAGGLPAAFLLGEDGLYRSADAGSTWRQVRLLAPGGERPLLALSPEFARDGLALLVVDGRLQRSDDGGANWTPVELAEAQSVRQVRFSPDFARDRTLFLAVTSGGFPSLLTDTPADSPTDDHVRSLGVVASVDGGATWTVTSEGLAAEGTPYRHVQQLAVSPTFASDGTLFAFAWGPREPGDFMGGTARLLHAALFRSRDRAATWEPVHPVEPSFTRTQALLALSPRFASDGIMLLAENSSGGSPASAGCTLLRSDDSGGGWQYVRPRGSYEGCGSLWLVDGAASPFAVVQKGVGWLQSADAGLTWDAFGPTDTTLVSVGSSVSPVPGGPPALPFFAGATFGGLWTFGPDARDTNGRLPCAADAEGGFGRIWRNEVWVRARLGCPLSAEQVFSVRLRSFERTLGERREPVRGVWIDDGSADWYELGDRTWLARAKAQQPWPSADQTVQGAVQRFAGGIMVWTPFPDGRRQILVLAEPDYQWREYPDLP